MTVKEINLQTYTLKGKGGNGDLLVTINDLSPIHHKEYSYDEFFKFLIYSDYEPDWDTPMGEEYDLLYNMDGNPKIDFFIIKNTKIIVVPGSYLYTTKLKMEDIPLKIEN